MEVGAWFESVLVGWWRIKSSHQINLQKVWGLKLLLSLLYKKNQFAPLSNLFSLAFAAKIRPFLQFIALYNTKFIHQMDHIWIPKTADPSKKNMIMKKIIFPSSPQKRRFFLWVFFKSIFPQPPLSATPATPSRYASLGRVGRGAETFSSWERSLGSCDMNPWDYGMIFKGQWGLYRDFP